MTTAFPIDEYDILETWTAGDGEAHGNCTAEEFERRYMNETENALERALQAALDTGNADTDGDALPGSAAHDPTVLTRNEYAVVRIAHAEDFELIGDLIAPFVGDGKLLARTYQEFDELMPNFFVAIAEEDGQIIGCVALEVYSRKLSEVRSLAVARRAQGKGIGRLLVAACVERARQLGVYEVMAITSSDGFFQSCGFDYTLPGAKRALFAHTREQY